MKTAEEITRAIDFVEMFIRERATGKWSEFNDLAIAISSIRDFVGDKKKTNVPFPGARVSDKELD